MQSRYRDGNMILASNASYPPALHDQFPGVYRQLTAFYRQDPLQRAGPVCPGTCRRFPAGFLPVLPVRLDIHAPAPHVVATP